MFYDPMEDRMVHFDVGIQALFQVHFLREDHFFHRFDSSCSDVLPLGVTRGGRFQGCPHAYDGVAQLHQFIREIVQGLLLVAVQNHISTYPST